MRDIADRPRLLIVGGSVRAAAWSAIRAGFAPVCLDAFADEDLRAVVEVLPGRGLRDLRRAARGLPANVPWMYTGAVENQPRRIAAMSRERPLLGCPAACVRAVRELVMSAGSKTRSSGSAIPATLRAADAGSAAGVFLPATRSAVDPPPADETWMLKPRRSGGGRGVTVWGDAAHGHPTLRAPHVFQERVEGSPMSAVCVAGERGSEVLGASRQWIGEAVCHAHGFWYCGSIGPVALPAAVIEGLRRLGDGLARQLHVRGLFGCDLIVAGETAWVVEINPRYTASIEVLEFAGGTPLVAAHAAACGLADLAANGRRGPVARGTGCVGKAILYAPRGLTVPELPVARFLGGNELPELADVPRAGAAIASGAPVCTAFACGGSIEECEATLRERVERWSDRLFGRRAAPRQTPRAAAQ